MPVLVQDAAKVVVSVDVKPVGFQNSATSPDLGF